MDDRRLALAEALLAKARSSAFEDERESFAAGAYRQLTAVLGAEPSAGRLRPATPVPTPAGLPPAPRPGGPSPGYGRVGLAARRYRDLERPPKPAGILVDVAI